LAEAIGRAGMQGARVLLARAAEAREVLPDELTRGGATVDVVPAYRTVRNAANADELRTLLRDGKIDAVTFTSSSTVLFFLELVGAEATELLRGVVVASIGPITAAAAARHGITSDVVPESYTIPGLGDALVRHFQEVGRPSDPAEPVDQPPFSVDKSSI